MPAPTLKAPAEDKAESSPPADPTQRRVLLRRRPPAEPGPAVIQRRVVITEQRWSRSVLSSALTIVAALLLGLVLHVVVLGSAKHARDQKVAYAGLRQQLAEAVAPVGQVGNDGLITPLGAPVALLEIPALDVTETVLEGTTSGVLTRGPGHRRDTALPGQPGTAVLFGRRAGYGRPFAGLDRLGTGDVIFVTTGQGRHEYRVTGARRAGQPLPPPLAAGQGRLTLATAAGRPLLPSGVLRLDADLVTEPQLVPARAFAGIPPAERALAGDRSVLPSLAWCLLALLVASVALTWTRTGWGRWQTYVVGVPVLGALGTAVLSRVAELLPNLL